MRWIVSIAALVAAIDQVTKFLIARYIEEVESRTVIPGFFNLVNWHNTGAAWGMFQNSNLVLTIVGVLCILAVLLFRHSLLQTHRTNVVALGLIAGGIIGNTIDRIRVGAVVDFLDFHFRTHHWPAFNVADSAICVGVGLVFWITWRSEHPPAKTAEPSAQS